MKTDKKNDLLEKVLSLAKRRGFVFPGSDIYGGLANSWDYGPLGVELKNNIKQEWWKRFVQHRADVVGIDAALLMNPKVWEASGHLKNFSDPLVECKRCHKRFRADAFPNEEILKHQETHLGVVTTYELIKQDFTEKKDFNLMLKTYLGPAEEQANIVYFRPETAQAMFVNFKNILDTNRIKLPFGIAQQGKAFRNEITPGNFIFRMREFEQMEIEYFVKESEWEKYFEHWLGEMKRWLKDLGVSDSKLHYVDIPDGERAHYSKRTVDVEYEYPFGQKELYGLAYRGDFDLKNHMEASGQDLRYTDTETNERFLPHVIEPTWGVDRSVLVAMLEAYHEDDIATPKLQAEAGAPTSEKGETETRVVMKFPYWMAPVKVAVFPLVKNKEEIVKKAREVFEIVLAQFPAQYDESGAVGRRYRRQDEIGTPLCVTIDFDTLQDNAVTVRDRDTMEQKRIKFEELVSYIASKLV
ncbi:MAG: glycine--tRNA ligase [Candidatus Spechtbacteria bacterium]|nr:glycine--tRNA ligase [Candidatus Spechtbacteria bacterium]